jgi:hypothetical protein
VGFVYAAYIGLAGSLFVSFLSHPDASKTYGTRVREAVIKSQSAAQGHTRDSGAVLQSWFLLGLAKSQILNLLMKRAGPRLTLPFPFDNRAWMEIRLPVEGEN